MTDGGGTDSGTQGAAGRAYWWYAAVQVVSLLGTMMAYTALYWLALHVGHGGAGTLSAVVAAEALPMLVLSRRAGLIVGRRRAVRVVMVTQGLQAAGALAIGIPLLAGWMTTWYLVTASLAIGCAQTVDLPARQTLMLDLVGPAGLRRGTSLYATVTGLAKIAGPGVAGLIIAATGETAVFFVDAASFLGVIAVLAVLARRGPAAVARGTARPPAQAARRGRWLLDLPPGIRAALLAALLVGGVGLQFGVTNPLMASRVFHLGAAGYGLLGTLVAVGAVAGAYLSSRRGDPGASEFLAWAAVFGVAEALAAVAPSAWAYGVLMVAIGAATQLFAVSVTVYIQQAAPAAQRGPALSAYNAAFIGFVPAGAVAVAGVAAVAGVRWALAGSGALVAVGAGGILAARLRAAARSPAPG
jgi:MFS family permease